VDLGSLLKSLKRVDEPNLLVGFDTADDAGVYKLRADLALVQTVDLITPVCDDPFIFGQIAAANSLSDVYAMGGKPLTVMNVCCFPAKGIPPGVFEKILAGGHEKTVEAGAVLVGGHTVKDEELKFGLSVTGTIHPEKVLRNSTARPGQALVLTKPLGTGVMITGSKRGIVPWKEFERVLFNMARLNAEAGALASEHDAGACTDITGFGLAGHGIEMARGCGAGLRFHFSALPHYPHSLALIEQGVKTGVTASNRAMVGNAVRFDGAITEAQQWLLFDPQTSGGLLVALDSSRADSLVRALAERGEPEARIVGEVFESPQPAIEVVP